MSYIRRGVPIIVFNPLRERALERFADPQNVMEMAALDADRLDLPVRPAATRRR